LEICASVRASLCTQFFARLIDVYLTSLSVNTNFSCPIRSVGSPLPPLLAMKLSGLELLH